MNFDFFLSTNKINTQKSLMMYFSLQFWAPKNIERIMSMKETTYNKKIYFSRSKNKTKNIQEN
jgi:hypothetical protein